jgi:hypothetical protein
VSYDGGISDDIGGLDEQGLGLRRRGLLTPPGQFQGVGTADFPEAPPISRAPQTTASATNEPPPITREPAPPSKYELYPPVKPTPRPYDVNLPGDVTPGIGRVRGELAARPPDIGAMTIPEAPPITAPSQPRAPTPAASAYESLRAKGPAWQREGIGGKILDVLGMTTGIGRNIELGSGLGSLGYQHQLGEARTAAEAERAGQFEEARTEEQKARAAKETASANAPAKRQYENINQLHADAVQEAIAKGVDPSKDPKVLQIEDSIQRTQREPAQRPAFTNPFEAFTFGTPEQKQSAQDFLAFEKKQDRENQRPSETAERYSLYLRDPDAYKAMYGNKEETGEERTRIADRAHATVMLKFFERQRDEIDKNYMLGDDEKTQKLREIDELEKPFKDAATAQSGKDTGRVEVIHPNGTHGTIPRSQLDKAKKKGYREAQP